jgi:nitronate monooxygenase
MEVGGAILDKERLSPLERAQQFSDWLGVRLPIIMAPMSGACPPSLAIAIANAGGLGGCGALLMQADEIKSWSDEFRKGSAGGFQINLWIPDPPPNRDAELERRERDFLAQWGPPVPPEAGDVPLPDFQVQCGAVLDAAPKVISSIMGLYPPSFVAELKKHGIVWFAAVTTVAEARAAEKAGADVIVAQGMEAGGHRGGFQADEAERQMAGLMALVPQVVDAVSAPVIATGGIADARGIAAALVLGASAVQIGTGFLRCPEANVPRAYADQLARTEPHETMVTRAFSGRPGRGVANAYTRAASGAHAPHPAPYPVQRGLTRGMREAAQKNEDTDRMQMWAGQSAKLAQDRPAGVLCGELWADASRLLR